MAHDLVSPPWRMDHILGNKLSRLKARRARGKAPLPSSKAEQRAIAASLADRPATKVEDGKRGLPRPYSFIPK